MDSTLIYDSRTPITLDRWQVVVAVFAAATATVGTIAVAIVFTVTIVVIVIVVFTAIVVVVVVFTAFTAVGVAIFIGTAIDAIIGTVAAVLIPFPGVVIGAVFFQLPVSEGLKVLLTIGQGGVIL
jgi:hypothetical protein